MEIYAFGGNLKTGKNYIAEKLFIPLLPFKNTLVMGFADHFKIDAINKENLKYEKVFGEKDDETAPKLAMPSMICSFTLNPQSAPEPMEPEEDAGMQSKPGSKKGKKKKK